MNTDNIKENIKELVGNVVLVRINIGRNRFESVTGIVSEMYPYLFTIKTDSEVKSFSYVDVLTKNVIIEKV